MGVQNPNSTNYVHPNEPNLLNVHKAMTYDPDNGEPHLRVTLGSDNITVSGNVNLVEAVRVNNTEAQMIPVYLVGNVLVVNQGTTPWVTTGNANVTVIGNIAGITTLPSITGNVGVSGNVSISQLPGITGNVGVSGNVEITSMPAIAGNVNANITGTANVNVTGTYEMNVAQGLIDGQYAEMKNGVALDLSQGAEATIWSQNTLYPWASWTTAQKLYIISSSASDTGQVLRIEGLNASFVKITEDVTTNGTTAVATTQNFLRINRCYMLTGATNVGTITQRLASGVGTVVGSMSIGYSRNKGGFFTVPAGYTAYILYGDATSFRGGSGNIGSVIKMFTRTNVTGVTTPFMNQFMSEVVNGQYRNDFSIPLQVPEKTDIDVRMVADGNNTQATCNWQMILIPNT